MQTPPFHKFQYSFHATQIHRMLYNSSQFTNEMANLQISSMISKFQKLLRRKFPESYIELEPDSTKDNRIDRIVHDLTKHGFSVVDNYLGEQLANAISEEVRELYETTNFYPGRLHNPSGPSILDQAKRGDKVLSIPSTDTDACCGNVINLMKRTDSLINQCNRHKKLEKCKIDYRESAMVTCYPGNGTKFAKHCDDYGDRDDSRKFGRCITAIYYLNKDWKKRDGGNLRLFPSNKNGHVDVFPILDRLLLFWSDTRNPHEVQPCYQNRFAITMWYCDLSKFKSEDSAALRASELEKLDKSLVDDVFEFKSKIECCTA